MHQILKYPGRKINAKPPQIPPPSSQECVVRFSHFSASLRLCAIFVFLTSTHRKQRDTFDWKKFPVRWLKFHDCWNAD